MTLSSIYFCIIAIFLMGCGVSHSITIHLIASLNKTFCSTYYKKNSSLSQQCSRNYSLVVKINLKFIMPIKTSAIQNFKWLSVDILYNLFLSDHDFSITVVTLFSQFPSKQKVFWLRLCYPTLFYKSYHVLTKTRNNLEQPETIWN